MLLIASLLFGTAARNSIWLNDATIWNDVIRNNPGNARGYIGLGDYYLQIRSYEEALGWYRKALAAAPTGPSAADACNNIGVYYMRSSVNDLAERYFDLALSMNSSYEKAYFNKSHLYSLRGDHARAIAALTKALTIDPSYAKAYAARGRSFLDAGRRDAAADDFRRACELGFEEACGIVQASGGQ